MNGRGGVRAMLIVVLLSGLALAYLYQHSCSVRLTREVGSWELRSRALRERAESLEVAVLRMSTFARLDSVWAAAGCPAPDSSRDAAAASGSGPEVALNRAVNSGAR